MTAQRVRRSAFRRWAEEAGYTRSVRIGGHRLHYIEVGRGEPVVLLHGLGGSATDWRSNVQALAEGGYRVLALDMLGAGLSDKPRRADYSVGGAAGFVRAFLDAVPAWPATLVGNSFGGAVALWVAEEEPRKVGRLVLISPISYRQPVPGGFRLATIPWLPDLLVPFCPVRPLIQRTLSRCVVDPRAITPEVVDAYVSELTMPGRRQVTLAIVRALVATDGRRFEEALRDVRAPTLLIWGRHDHAVPLAYGERLRREMGNARLLVLPETGHIPHQERPDLVNAAILEFLASDPPADPGRP